MTKNEKKLVKLPNEVIGEMYSVLLKKENFVKNIK